MRYWMAVLLCALVELGSSCGNPSAAPAQEVSDARQPAGSDRYLPLSVGARWTYLAADSSGMTQPTESVVQALEDVGGTQAGIKAFKIRSTTLAGATVNWQQDLGSSVVRLREQFFDSGGLLRSEYVFQPNRLRLDESPAHAVAGTTWTESHTALVEDFTTGVKQTANFSVQWTVESVDATITVPAGTFTCLRVRRVQTGFASSDETHWFARHVGKVKETGPEAKELTSYSIP